MTSLQPDFCKTFMPHDCTGLVELMGGHLTTLFERGNIKTAASDLFTRKDLDDNAPDKDHFMIHQIVMGCQEKWSFNNNGDGFPDEGLRRDHPTFVTHGHVYREHRNHNPALKIGDIKAVKYSTKMGRVETLKHIRIDKAEKEYQMAKEGKEIFASMACFPAGTMVRMVDWTEKPIEEIKCGDTVLTHKGQRGTVSHTMHRDYADGGVALRAYGLPEEVICTKDHGIWTRPTMNSTDPCPVCGEVFRGLAAHMRQKKDSKHQAAYRDYGRYCEGFRPAASLRRADYVRTAVDVSETEGGEVWQARLLGLYLAEGSLFCAKTKHPGGSPRSDFTFHIKEKELHRETAEHIVKFTGKEAYVRDRPAGNSTFVRSSNRSLFNWLLTHGGKGAAHKRLSAEVMLWKSSLQKHILEAWLEGDGCWHKTNEILTGVTVSRTLAVQMMEIAARCGISASIQTYQSKKPTSLRSYQVVFSAMSCADLNVSKKPQGWKMSAEYSTSYGHLRHQPDATVLRVIPARKLAYVEGGFVYRKIARLRHVFINERVYDLTVPGDHGFQVGMGIGVSNCRVPYDVCSCCDQRAKYASLYCGHLRDHMGQWMPEFKKYAFAVNPEGTYFDDSVVDNPAARMARHIEYRFGPQENHLKAASSRPVLSGAQWAEFGMRHSSLRPDIMQTLHKLASLEVEPPDVWRTSVSQYAFDKTARLGSPTWDLANRLMPGTFFRKLASKGVLLPFDHFCSYVTGRSVPDLRQDSDFRKEASGLPSLFRSLAELLERDECCCGQQELDMFTASGAGFADVDPSSCDSIDKIMDEAADNWSVEVAPLQRRSSHIIAVKKASVWIPSGVVPLSPLAVMYGMYKLAALHDIQNLSKHVHPGILFACAVDQNLDQACPENG